MSQPDFSFHTCSLQRLPPKRKLDDFTSIDESDAAAAAADDLMTIRMKNPDHPSSPEGCICGSSSSSFRFVHHQSEKPQLQLFVRMFPGRKTLILCADLKDTVGRLHEMIEAFTGIRTTDHRFIYRGKQLLMEQTLEECSIQNDDVLRLLPRMRSTSSPIANRLVMDMIYFICGLLRNDYHYLETYSVVRFVKDTLDKYVAGIPCKKKMSFDFAPDALIGDFVVEYLRIFVDSSAYKAFVMLYLSPQQSYQDCAYQCIQLFVAKVAEFVDKQSKAYGALIVLEFCRLLGHDVDDLLYIYCRSSLGLIVKDIGVAEVGTICHSDHCIMLKDIVPFFWEVTTRLAKDMDFRVELNDGDKSLSQKVADFSSFLHPFRSLMLCGVRVDRRGGHPYVDISELLHDAYSLLSFKVDQCLEKMEANLAAKRQAGEGTYETRCRSFLSILKELNSISTLLQDDRVLFQAMVSNRRVSLQALVVGHVGHDDDDHEWLFSHKDVLDFVSRRHLAMLMFPNKEELEMHEMLIDRDQLLEESFEYISRAEADSLHAGLFMEFKNEEATGPGVLREWFFLVCQAIFNPHNALFASCPHDRRRFFPNPASKVDPMHLRYFHFSGRVVALALMHKVQLGIVFDRIFFLQLAGEEVSLEDIKDADPYLYNSCKQILEMDAEFIDSDALGLTFVWEVEELGSRKVVELCPGGKSIMVNSKNREDYIKHLVKYRFVTSISDQASEFARGFSDVIGSSANRRTFFRYLELDDFDSMLHGSVSAISVEDWKEHIDYKGYKKSDPQICWFWEIVGEMSAEQKNVLLFFWTSIKYLPVEGFRGLGSQLFIYISIGSIDCLPSSHTCFYQLFIPQYPSKDIMKNRLSVITQEYVGCSFGTP